MIKRQKFSLKTRLTGFTLIEILIALTVFAILSSITSFAMYHAFNTRAKVNAQADRLRDIQLAISQIENDSQQIVERPIRIDDMQLQSAFIGNSSYVEFTRNGNFSPLETGKKSTLQRIALVCTQNALLRRSWAVPDPIHYKEYQDKILISSLKKCRFNYLNQHLQLLPNWLVSTQYQGKAPEPLPKAVQLSIDLSDWGDANFLFAFPPALLGNSHGPT